MIDDPHPSEAAPGAAVTDPRRRRRTGPIVFVAAYFTSYLVGLLAVPFLPDVSLAVLAWANLAVPLVFAVIGSWVFRDAWARGIRLTAERPWATMGLFVAGLVAMFLLPLAAAIVAAALGAPVTGANQAGLEAALGGTDSWIAITLAAVVAGPIAEELVFREALAWRLRSRVPAALLILGSSALFGIWHLRGLEELPIVLVYAAMGLVLVGLMWVSRGNLLLAIATHAARNLMSVLLVLAIAA